MVRIMVIDMLDRQTVIEYLKSLSQNEIECEKTYVPTTGTVLSISHFGMDVWQEFLRQTLEGNALSYAEKNLGLTHQTAFNMRHKLLMALEDFFDKSPVVLGDVTEFDETFVLDSYKEKTIPETVGRPSRRHGVKACTPYGETV